jgi:hypothetical protein
MSMKDEPYADAQTIERLESLLHGFQALHEHVDAAEMDHVRLVVNILRNEIEQLISDCKEVGGAYFPKFGQHTGVCVLRLRFPMPSTD